MSSILKALRKIEEEKRVAQHAAPDLRVDQGLSRSRSMQFLPLLSGIALGAIVVGLFTLWLPRTDTPVTKDDAVTNSSEVLPLVELGKGSPAPDPVAQVAEALPVRKALPEVSRTNPLADNRAESSRILSANMPPEPMPATVVAVPEKAVSSALPEGVSLTVSEIILHEDKASSVAVINDLPVMVGTYVDSAIVTEIRQDSVLFSIEDKIYTVAISSP
jgi:general secretion pathway protein B